MRNNILSEGLFKNQDYRKPTMADYFTNAFIFLISDKYTCEVDIGRNRCGEIHRKFALSCKTIQAYEKWL